MAEPISRASIVLWAAIIAPIIITGLRLTALNPANSDVSCYDAEAIFETIDFASAVPDEPALLIGNSRVHYWQDKPAEFRGHSVVSRTVPGLTIENIDGCFPRLIGHYQPELVVLVLDSIANQKEAESALQSLSSIIAKRALYGLYFDLWIAAPISTPRSATGLTSSLPTFSEELVAWASDQTKVFVIDPSPALNNQEGLPDATLFWPNGDTLNSAGYKKLQTALQDAINARG